MLICRTEEKIEKYAQKRLKVTHAFAKTVSFARNRIRRKEFNKFITLGSYEAQLLYICSNVTETRKKRSYISENTSSQVKKPRIFSRTYRISNIPVCRDMFLNTFQVTTQKITISLKKQRNRDNLRDCRGFSSGGWNKTPQEQIDFVYI